MALHLDPEMTLRLLRDLCNVLAAEIIENACSSCKKQSKSPHKPAQLFTAAISQFRIFLCGSEIVMRSFFNGDLREMLSKKSSLLEMRYCFLKTVDDGYNFDAKMSVGRPNRRQLASTHPHYPHILIQCWKCSHGVPAA